MGTRDVWWHLKDLANEVVSRLAHNYSLRGVIEELIFDVRFEAGCSPLSSLKFLLLGDT